MLLVSIGIVTFCLATGDWFGMNAFLPIGSALVVAYFITTALAAAWFYKKELSVVSEQG